VLVQGVQQDPQKFLAAGDRLPAPQLAKVAALPALQMPGRR
jgi:hypothetical protein